ncbi:LysR substrate-binding domain-containing protein [Pseudoalteromonas sp. AOP31-A2-14]|uniref:LysR substrate-binding domain-containing protein n=1 Tax=Pseudoalteromonas sp. AOP31-A2-14 TaxID=3457695 RepID=UPI004036E180
MAKYHKIYPNVNFIVQTVHNNEVSQALSEHKCDIAILFSPKAMPGITAITLAQSELVIVYPKASFPSLPKQLTLEDLTGSELIDISDSGPLSHILLQRMMQEDIQLNSTIKVQTYFIAAKLVAQGLGVCIIDKFTALGNLSDNMAIASFNPPLNFNVNALHLENRALSKASNTFLFNLKNYI